MSENTETVDYGERALAIAERSPEVVAIIDPGLDNHAKLALVKKTYGRDLTDAQFYLLITEANHWGLDVFKREFGAIVFKGQPVNMPFRKGLAKLANRSPLMAGTDGPYFCDASGKWVPVWLGAEPPAAARYTIHRTDRPNFPITRYAVWKERAQYDGTGKLMPNWAKMPAHMLAKVAETDCLKASGLIDADLLARGVSIDEPEDYDGRGQPERLEQLRRAHAIAKDAGGHAAVRATVHALDPAIESLTQADAEILEQAGDLISGFGANAPAAVFSPDDEYSEREDEAEIEFDPRTGEILEDGISAREQWRITIREIHESQDAEAIKTLPDLAGDSPELWEDLIASGVARGPLLDAWIITARKAGVSDNVIMAGMRRRDDAKATISERGKARAAAVRSGPGTPDASGAIRSGPGMPERGEYTNESLYGGEAPRDTV